MDQIGEFIHFVKIQRLIIDYAYVNATALFVYDYTLMLHLEIKYIWFSPWTYTKVSFLVIRYLAFLNTIVVIYHQAFPNLSVGTCKVVFPLASFTAMIVVFLAELVIAIRTWAVWNRSRVIGVGLGALMLGNFVFASIRTSGLVNSAVYAPPPYPGFRGCFITNVAPDELWPIYAFSTAAEATMLALMVISAFRIFGHDGSCYYGLLFIIHRDGIICNFYLLCITATSMIMKLAAPIDLKFLFDDLLDILHPILVARVFINIRQAASKRIHTEPQTFQSLTFAPPLQRGPVVPSVELNEFARSPTRYRGVDGNVQ